MAGNSGQFKKGDPRRGPGGRKKTDPEVKAMLQAALPSAVQLLIDTMGNAATKPELRVQCANTIIERVMGKAAQPIVADVFKSETPLTLDECFAMAEEVLHETGGTGGPATP